MDIVFTFSCLAISSDDAGFDALSSQVDSNLYRRVEGDKVWIFRLGVLDPNGNKVQPSFPVSVYVQIGDDWNLDELNAYYISAGADASIPIEDVKDFPFPEENDEFGRMTLSHFSPYIIFDELTDAEKATLTPLTQNSNDNKDQNTDNYNCSGTELLISGFAIVLVYSLGVMLRLITGKKKFED